MIGVVHCPNPACGHPSPLSLDPPGRVFRCRRCQTKLPAVAIARQPAAALASTGGDPGWASTSDDDLGDWLDRTSDGSSGSAAGWGVIGSWTHSARGNMPGSTAAMTRSWNGPWP
jgi:hypothetical protein